MPAWPTSLPQELLQDGYRSSFPDNVLRSAVDSGPEKTRKRFTVAPYPISGRMFMTSTQLATFRTWFDDMIGSGASEFDFTDPLDDTVTLSVKFREPPSWRNIGGDNYQVSLAFNVLP